MARNEHIVVPTYRLFQLVAATRNYRDFKKSPFPEIGRVLE